MNGFLMSAEDEVWQTESTMDYTTAKIAAPMFSLFFLSLSLYHIASEPEWGFHTEIALYA